MPIRPARYAYQTGTVCLSEGTGGTPPPPAGETGGSESVAGGFLAGATRTHRQEATAQAYRTRGGGAAGGAKDHTESRGRTGGRSPDPPAFLRTVTSIPLQAQLVPLKSCTKV